MENMPLSGARCSFMRPFLFSQPREGFLLHSPPPTSEPCAGTCRRGHELNQNYVSLAVSQSSETVRSHWRLHSQGRVNNNNNNNNNNNTMYS